MKALVGVAAGFLGCMLLALCALVAMAGVVDQAAQLGSAQVGALRGPAVPSEWQAAEAEVPCAGVPPSVLGALGFVASGSGRWLARPAPWALSPSGPLGLGISRGTLSAQITSSVTELCWRVGATGLSAALRALVGQHFVAVLGVLATSLQEAPWLSASRAQAVTFAAEALGVPYQWGGNGPSTYDCSGLMVAAWRSAGVVLPRVAQAQHDALANAHDYGAPGDLVFYGSSPKDVTHVGMWIRDGVLLDAPYTGAVVRLDPMRLATAVSVGSVG